MQLAMYVLALVVEASVLGVSRKEIEPSPKTTVEVTVSTVIPKVRQTGPDTDATPEPDTPPVTGREEDTPPSPLATFGTPTDLVATAQGRRAWRREQGYCPASNPFVLYDEFDSHDPRIFYDSSQFAGKDVVFVMDQYDEATHFPQLSLIQTLQGWPTPYISEGGNQYKTYMFNHKYEWTSVNSLTIVIPWFRYCQMERIMRWSLTKQQVLNVTGDEDWSVPRQVGGWTGELASFAEWDGKSWRMLPDGLLPVFLQEAGLADSFTVQYREDDEWVSREPPAVVQAGDRFVWTEAAPTEVAHSAEAWQRALHPSLGASDYALGRAKDSEYELTLDVATANTFLRTLLAPAPLPPGCAAGLGHGAEAMFEELLATSRQTLGEHDALHEEAQRAFDALRGKAAQLREKAGPACPSGPKLRLVLVDLHERRAVLDTVRSSSRVQEDGIFDLSFFRYFVQSASSGPAQNLRNEHVLKTLQTAVENEAACQERCSRELCSNPLEEQVFLLAPDKGAYKRFRFDWVDLGLDFNHIHFLQKVRKAVVDPVTGLAADFDPWPYMMPCDGEPAAQENMLYPPGSKVLVADDFTNSGSTLLKGMAKAVQLKAQHVMVLVTHFFAGYSEKNVEVFVKKFVKLAGEVEGVMEVHCTDSVVEMAAGLQRAMDKAGVPVCDGIGVSAESCYRVHSLAPLLEMVKDEFSEQEAVAYYAGCP